MDITTSDSADEVDPALNVVKGRGGALLREKVRRMGVHACAGPRSGLLIS